MTKEQAYIRLLRTVKYAGFNIDMPILKLLLNEKVIQAVKRLRDKTISSPNMTLDELDKHLKELGL